MKRINAWGTGSAIAAITLFAIFSSAMECRAADYPSRAIRLILPQPPGGAVDFIARTLGKRLTKEMKVPIVVENKPGANGTIAAEKVARARPDGYTLLFAVDNNLVINPHLYHNLHYDPFRDFSPISIIAKVHLVMVANPRLKVNTVRELIAFARAHPGKLNYASFGFGTPPHMGMELFKLMTKTKINRVPYRGSAAATQAVVAGFADVTFVGPGLAKGMSAGGKLKLLAFTGTKRSPLLPNVPTIAEAGLPDFHLAGWFGVLAPAHTPQSIINRLSAEVHKAVNPQFKERLAKQGLDAVGGTPGAMLATMRSDYKRWGNVIKSAGIKIPE